MALPITNQPPKKALLSVQAQPHWAVRNVRWLLAGTALTIFFYIYLVVGLQILWNYAFWIFNANSVRLAQPVSQGATQLPVPKLLHQTWRDNNLPEKWKAAQKSCIDAHPDYEYKLWTDEDAEKLVADKFPWFLKTYKAYPHNIQRADVLRYFVLYEYGGIYLDLDIECVKSLDEYRGANFTAPKTYPIGVSNDVMISKPKDGFAYRLVSHLQQWQKWFFFKYATVMFSTGPMFVTIQYSLFSHKNDVTVLPANVYGKYDKSPGAYLKHLHGSSWHGGDAKYILWLDHYGLKAAAVLALVSVTALTALLVSKKYPHVCVRLQQYVQHTWRSTFRPACNGTCAHGDVECQGSNFRYGNIHGSASNFRKLNDGKKTDSLLNDIRPFPHQTSDQLKPSRES